MPSDLTSKCRTCLCESNNYHQLLGYVDGKYKILEMLDCLVPQIDVKTTSTLSSLVCHTCVDKLLIGYKFQQSCIETNNRLHDLLGITLFETHQNLENIIDPLAAESNLKMKEEISDVCVESNTQKEDLDEGEQSLNKNTPDDSDTNNENLSALKKRKSKLNRRRGSFPCTECGKMFRSLNRLKQHEDKHKIHEDIQELDDVIERDSRTVPKQKMELTPETFDNDYKNSGNKEEKCSFPCEICGKIFGHANRLKKHGLVHSFDPPPECKVCKYCFASENFCRAHLFQQNNDTGENSHSQSQPEPFECPDCFRRFEKKSALSAHRQSHTRNTSGANYPCPVCQRSYMSIRSLTEHITNKHTEVERHKCDECDKTFVLHAHLVQHLNRHKGNRNVVCLICEKQFAFSKTLKEHMRTHSGESPYLCTECGKTFRTPSNLNQHMVRHKDLKQYQCPECPSRFKCRSYLVKHAVTHSNGKPHVCDICGSHFRRTTSLQKHKLLHSGKRPFKCDQCGMTFAVIYHLRRHMRTHTGEKPYKCKYCERAYAESGDLTKHLRTHVGENTYMCDQCPMSFKYQAELRQHQSLHYKTAQKLLEKDNDNPKTP